MVTEHLKGYWIFLELEERAWADPGGPLMMGIMQ